MGDSIHGSSSSASSTSEVAENTPKFVHFPHKDFITFPQKIDREKAEGKLRELNSKYGDTLSEEQGRWLMPFQTELIPSCQCKNRKKK